MRKNLGLLLLGVWLVITGLMGLMGLMGLLHFAIPFAGVVLNLLALVAGILIVAGR